MANTPLDDLVNDQSTSNNILLHIYVFGLGFFLIGYWTIRFDFGTELAYPNPASTVCGLTAACCDVAGIIISLITSKIVDNYGTLSSNMVLVALLSVGMCLLIKLKPEYKRQAANAVKPLIGHHPASNPQTNTNYGTLDSKWHLTDSRTALINAAQSCKAEYGNVCFNFQPSNAMLAN